ncbi:hypothetical protein DPMN_186035 [Dreissena polymorpha]|uniref:Uncharacterized protein n=1 Tax=Dreissena polymorpha TaxID=45954 RepID=A0A9D4DLM0_DREPO|nr:hypothetical protein DPMN_186035 [Dreissena polymorpha]
MVIQNIDAADNDDNYDDDAYGNAAAADYDDDYMMGLVYKKNFEVQTRNLQDNKTSHSMKRARL